MWFRKLPHYIFHTVHLHRISKASILLEFNLTISPLTWCQSTLVTVCSLADTLIIYFRVVLITFCMCYKHTYSFAADLDQATDAFCGYLNLTTLLLLCIFSSHLNISKTDLRAVDYISELLRTRCYRKNTTPNHRGADSHGTNIIKRPLWPLWYNILNITFYIYPAILIIYNMAGLTTSTMVTVHYMYAGNTHPMRTGLWTCLFVSGNNITVIQWNMWLLEFILTSSAF